MKKWLIIGYFVLLVTLIFITTIDRLESKSPLWSIILTDVLLGLVAVSILLYGLSFKPKRFNWFWKLIPVMYVVYYVPIGYFVGPALIDMDGSLLLLVLTILVGIAFLFPSFYLSFKFGYYKNFSSEKINLKFVVFILTVTILCVASRSFPYKNDKINIKVNYVAKLNEISRPANYDPNDNAAPHYQKAFELCVKRPEQLNASDVKIWPDDLPPGEQVLLEDWVSANSDALQQLRLGSQKPYHWLEYRGSDMWDTLMPSAAEARSLTYALCLSAKLDAMNGNFESAFSDLLSCYKMGIHLACFETLVEQLVGIAVRALSVQTGLEILYNANPAPDSLEYFQSQLEGLSNNSGCIVDFTAEKLLVYDNIQRTFTDDGKGNGHLYGTRLLENKEYVKSVFGEELTGEQEHGIRKLERRQTTELADKVYEYFSQQAHKTPWQLRNEGENIGEVAEEMVKDDLLLRMFMPAADRVIELSFRAKVETEALITTLAVLRYKADKGRFPENLNQLIGSDYLRELPVDPYSNEPLMYKRAGDDFILYSFGVDFDDDGGVPSKWGEGEKGGDQVFWPMSEKQR